MELQPDFVEILQTPFLLPQRAELVWGPVKGTKELATQTLRNGSSKQWKYVLRGTIYPMPTHEQTNEQEIGASVFTAGGKPDVWSIDSIAPVPGPSVTQHDSSTATRRQQEQRALKSLTHTTNRFNKEELNNARIIGQVDCKFVACSLPGDSTNEGEPVLVLIDQHAADERVRVERFLKELCKGALQGGVESAALDAKKGVVLTRDEATLLEQKEVLQELRRWGLHLEPVAITESLTANWVQVDVVAVPGFLRDKVRRLSFSLHGEY